MKVEYENIYEWSRSDQGNCFYCYQDDTELSLKLLGEKGICKNCLENFEIGNLAVDRHVVNHIHPEFKSHQDGREWFKQHGKLMLNDTVRSGDQKWYLYSFRSKAGVETPLEISENGGIHIIY